MRRAGTTAASLAGGAALALAAAVLTPAAASAPEPPEGESLRADAAVPRYCPGQLHEAGAPGIARRAWTVPASGFLTAKLEGGLEGDWDLALFELPGGEPLGASTSVTSIEQATVWVDAGDRVAIQACRRHGATTEVPLGVELFETVLPEPSGERFSLESVPISGPQDVARLEELGLDVTHDVTPTEATVALYSDAERDLLTAAGFEAETVIADLAAADEADREAEARSAPAPRSDHPSGRATYRVYEDYTTELKQLAEDNPDIVRPVVIGLSFEGRPIEGIEIAADVHRRDDGRPAYLQMGLHHAREWPSGEWPMEFAHDLVERYDAGEERVTEILERTRTFVHPVINPDGFIASRSYGTSPLDDDANATLAMSLNDQAAYKRKNCRPTVPGSQLLPCAQRTNSGVDLNRNYGYYWGGIGSSTDTTTQSYRGTAPFSEPESEAVRRFSSGLHPTVLITSHTFVVQGTWLRQPGFTQFGNTTPDEAAMKGLGDAMGDDGTGDPTQGATGWRSQLAHAIGQITGATEDWNYFAQGTYGYTPEGRGPNFHANYASAVVTEYVGDAHHPDQGVREAFLIAAEWSFDADHHGVVEGTAPPGATLRLRKVFSSPTCQPSCGSPALFNDEDLDTTLRARDDGTYEWHVNPSRRPALPGVPEDEAWTMTCRIEGQPESDPVQVDVDRGERVTVDWRGGPCGVEPPDNVPPLADFIFAPSAPLAGQPVTFTSTSTDSDGEITSHEWDLDDDGEFDDAEGPVAVRTFPTQGSFDVSLRVTDDAGASDVRTRAVVVGAAAEVDPPVPPVPLLTCRGRVATHVGTPGDDVIVGTQGDDVIVGLGGNDRIFGRGGDDLICAGRGNDRVFGGRGNDVIFGGRGSDRLYGGPGDDRVFGNGGRDRIFGGPGNDRLFGGLDHDRLFGGRGRDRLFGGRGNDRLRGGRGRDRCLGGPGRNSFRSCQIRR